MTTETWSAVFHKGIINCFKAWMTPKQLAVSAQNNSSIASNIVAQ
jgi:hypothetical protein